MHIIISRLFLLAVTIFLKADAADPDYSDCVDKKYFPYPSFPGCNDTSILCVEDQGVMENCCKCRCSASYQPDYDSCYTPPFPWSQNTSSTTATSSPPSIQGHQNQSHQPSPSPNQMLLSVATSSPAPSVATVPDPTPPPTNYYQNWQQNGGGENSSPLPRSMFIFLALFFFLTVLMKGNQFRTHRRHRRYRAARADRLRRAAMQQEGMMIPPTTNGDDAARYERIKSKFYFQVVLPDQSNVNPESLKSNEITTSSGGGDVESRSSLKGKSDSAKKKKINEEPSAETNEGETSEPAADGNRHHSENAAGEDSLNHSFSSIVTKPPPHHHPSLCEVISSWASVGSTAPPSDVCCICLEQYSFGDIICVAKKPTCDHLFHKDCVLEWMRTNDECPLCRINLLR